MSTMLKQYVHFHLSIRAITLSLVSLVYAMCSNIPCCFPYSSAFKSDLSTHA
ncbi:hypothetical protein BDW72DRAFT_181452 [Aspergillus terricola var. indicus]